MALFVHLLMSAKLSQLETRRPSTFSGARQANQPPILSKPPKSLVVHLLSDEVNISLTASRDPLSETLWFLIKSSLLRAGTLLHRDALSSSGIHYVQPRTMALSRKYAALPDLVSS